MAGAARIGRGHLAGPHGAEGTANEGRVLEAQLLQQLVVAEDQVPEAIQMIDVVGRAGCGAGMLGSVHGEVLCQRVEERIPVRTPGAVEEDERGASAFREDAHADSILPDGDYLGSQTVQVAHREGPLTLPSPPGRGGGMRGFEAIAEFFRPPVVDPALVLPGGAERWQDFAGE